MNKYERVFQKKELRIEFYLTHNTRDQFQALNVVKCRLSDPRDCYYEKYSASGDLRRQRDEQS